MHHVMHLLDQVALGISVSAQTTGDALLFGLGKSAVVEDLQAKLEASASMEGYFLCSMKLR